MAGRASIRVSDAERERVADRLRAAAAEGRLLIEELEERLEATFAARTYGQLDVLLADLPDRGRRSVSRPRRRRGGGMLAPALHGALAALLLAMVAIVVLLVLTGVFAGWLLWLVAGWWFWGRHGHRRCGPWGGRAGYVERGGRVHPGRGLQLAAIAEAHATAKRWAAEQGVELTGACWEIYGHERGDPADFELLVGWPLDA